MKTFGAVAWHGCGNWRSLILAGATLLMGARVAAAQEPFVQQLRFQWESSRKQMAEIADAMPSDKFDYRPTPEVRSFGEIVAHFAGEDMTWMETVEGAAKPGSPDRFEGLKTKPEILKALADSYDYGTKVLAGLNDTTAMANVSSPESSPPRWVMVEQAIGHTKEHYGNLVTYLRLNHIVPPSTARENQRRQL